MERLGPLTDDMVLVGGCATGLLLKEDQSLDAPICRWVAAGMVLDIMPTRSETLGFGNEWYQPALDAAMAIKLPSGKRIRMVTAPYFLVTKLAAFESRGNGDYVVSHDMEDIVAVLDGRSEIVDEVRQTDEALHKHLTARFAALLRNNKFEDALPGHLPGDAVSQARALVVLDRISAIVNK